jgi:hypothetical protein
MSEQFYDGQGHGDGETRRDEALYRELREALRDVLPQVDEVARRAKSAFTWRTVDEDLLLAELSFDTARTADPALTRDAAQGNRVLVFQTDLQSVELEVLTDRLVGQFVPPSAGQVDVEGEDGVLATVAVDDLGFFVVEPVPATPIRLQCTTATTRLVTEWVRL